MLNGSWGQTILVRLRARKVYSLKRYNVLFRHVVQLYFDYVLCALCTYTCIIPCKFTNFWAKTGKNYAYFFGGKRNICVLYASLRLRKGKIGFGLPSCGRGLTGLTLVNNLLRSAIAIKKCWQKRGWHPVECHPPLSLCRRAKVSCR